jgi:hypothetical protein
MKNYQWLVACLALVTAGLIAGCGGGDDSTTAPAATGAESTSTDSTSTTSSTEASSTDASPDDVYNACVDALEGVASESTAQSSCGQVRDAFEQCATQAENAPEGSARDAAIKACQDAANQTVDSLNASG